MLGVLSLIFWSLILVVSIKYLVFVMRADNDGEGGILALMALVVAAGRRAAAQPRGARSLLGLFGAALLYGDGMITPAISVLSAVEGLASRHATSSSRTSCRSPSSILVGLFLVQTRGTAAVGALFGPVMLVWFVDARACSACRGSSSNPAVLAALNPLHAVRFFAAQRLPRLPRPRRRCSWSSPAARRSTPTWATSAAGRSASPGSRSCCRRCC